MSYLESVEFDFADYDGPRDRPHTVRGKRLVPTTPEVNREVAQSAMLLAQGAERAAAMLAEAEATARKRKAPRRDRAAAASAK